MLSLLFALFLRRNLGAPADPLTPFIPGSLLDTRDIIATSGLLLSVAFSLYFSVVDNSYIFSLIFCILQVLISVI